jgi:hypothetical protein
MPFRHARVATIANDSAGCCNLHLRLRFRLCSIGGPGDFFLLYRFEPHVDRGGGKIGLDVRRIAFLDHPAYAIPRPGRMRKNSVLNEQLQQGGSTGVCRPRVG